MSQKNRNIDCILLSLPMALFLTMILFIIKYTVLPTMPVWVACLPVIVSGIIISAILLFVVGCLGLGLLCAIMADILENK